MKKLILAFLLILTTPLQAKPKANPADYTLTVHVISSRIVYGGDNSYSQRLNTIIDGKNIELGAILVAVTLQTGDYKAKLISNPKSNGYEITDRYELIFPDGKTRSYFVAGVGPDTAVDTPAPTHP